METPTHRDDDAAEAVDLSIAAVLPEIMPIADGTEPAVVRAYDASQTRGQLWLWLAVFLVVFGFGYLSSTRRAALGTFFAQVGDVIQDFRGYDPEV